jgi:predicted TIM-barrel fold metal-dependent hydrolase
MPAIVDSHAHFVPESVAHRPERESEHPNTAGMPHDLSETELLALLDAAGVDKLVQVTPTAMRFDNAHGLVVARRNADRVRVVASLDTTAADAPDRLRALAAEEHVVGVRAMLLVDNRRLLDGDTLHPLWAAASDTGLPVSVYVPRAAAQLAAVARAFPDMVMVVDHACVDLLHATPRAERFQGWQDVPLFAPLNNVWLKISGIPEGTEERFPYPEGQQRLRDLYDRFGPERLMWASNYPPSGRAGSYRESLEWVRGADFLDAHARDTILGGTACRVFGLPWSENAAIT